MHRPTLIAAIVFASLLVAGGSDASRVDSPVLFLEVAGFYGAVEMTPAGTLVGNACSTYCGFDFPPNVTSVQLAARRGRGSFIGWAQLDPTLAPACSGTVPRCRVDVRTYSGVTAAFSPDALVLKAGKGGTVQADPRPSCGHGCRLFAYGDVAHVRAHAEEGYRFSGWQGICASAAPIPDCNVRMREDRSAVAHFRCNTNPCSSGSPVDYLITIIVKVKGPGRITGSQIDCRSQCRLFDLAVRKNVSLAAVADPGATFRGWTSTNGKCAGRGERCTFAADKTSRGYDPVVTAWFG